MFFHCSSATNRINIPNTIEAILGNGSSRFARAVATVEVLFFAPLLRDTYLFQPHPCVARHEFVTHVIAKILVAAIQTCGETIFVTRVTRQSLVAAKLVTWVVVRRNSMIFCSPPLHHIK